MHNPQQQSPMSLWMNRTLARLGSLVAEEKGFAGGHGAVSAGMAGVLLCVLVAGGISLAQRGGQKGSTTERKAASLVATTTSANTPSAQAQKPEKQHASKAVHAQQERNASPTTRVEVAQHATVPAPPRIVLAPPVATSEVGQSEKENSEIGRARASWFFDQRAYPFEHIPEGALQKAIQQRDAMKASQRAAAGPQSAANGIVSFPGDALWHLMGPQPVNNPFGQNGGSPTASGRVTAIAVDPSDATGNTVYIGGAAGGVWKTTDGGANWTPLTDSQPSLSVGSIAIDPNNHLTIYVGTGEENFNGDAFYGAGILKSTDGGTTWTQIGASTFAQVLGTQTGGAFIGSIAVQPGNSSIVLAAVSFFVSGTTGGIYRSTDGGTTWTEDAAPQGLAATGVFFESTSNAGTTATAWAAMGDIFGQAVNGIYKSTDSGLTWTLQTGTGANVLPTTNLGRITLGYAPSTSGASATVYAAIADSSVSSNDLLGLFKTTDGGANWMKLTAAPAFCNHQCWYDMAVGVHPTNPSVVVLGGGAYTLDGVTSLFESINGGTNWTGTGTDDFSGVSAAVHPHVDTHAVVFTPSGTTLRLYVGNDGGAWRTDNPVQGTVSPTWVDLNAGTASGGTAPGTGLAITQFYPGISAGISDENYGFGGTQDNDIELFSGSFAWTNESACGDGGFTAIDPSIPTTVYAACDKLASPLIQKSVFNGEVLAGPSNTFNPADSGITTSEKMEFIPPLTIDEGNPNTLYFGTCHVWQTNDGATTWNAITGDLASGTNTLGAPCGGSGDITTMDVAHQNSGNVLAGTSNGKVWETLDATAGALSTWTEIDNGVLPPRHVTAVRTQRNDSTGNVAYVTFSGFGSCSGCGAIPGHVFLTSNATAVPPTWTDISGNLPDIPVNDLIVFHQNNPAYDALYIATDVGVFTCAVPALTLCAEWTVVGDGLPNSPVLGLAMRPPSRILRAATHGRSMWDIQLTDVNPPPVAFLASLTPAAAHVGDPTTPVTVTGGNFSTNTQVLFDGVSVGTPTFVSTTQLTISVNSSLLTTGHVFQVSLSDTQGVDAGTGPFTVMNPILTATNMIPNSTTAYTPVTLTFTGTHFVSSSNGGGGTLVTFNNVPLSGGTASAGGTSFSVQVPAFLLTTAGPATVTITNPLPGGGPTPISFAFTINPGTIVINPSPILLFAPLGTTSTPVTNVQLINSSASSATITAQSITGTNAANFSFAATTALPSCNFPTSGQSGNINVILAANGGTCNFGITYFANPTTPGNAVSNATLSVTDTASGSPQTAPIQGTPFAPGVLLLPVSFGAVTVGTTSPTTNATLSNFSGSPISVTSAFTISGTNHADFSIVPFVANGDGNSACPTSLPFPLASNASCDVSLTFTPSLPAGNETAQLNVTASVAVTTTNPNLIGTGIEVTSILPPIVATGGPAFTLTVNGGGFAASAVVNVNGSARLTTFVSTNELLASIPASDIATAGTLAITVTSPNPGGTTSEPKTLFIAQAPPANNDNINFALFHKAGATTIRTASGPFTGGGNPVTLTWSSPFANTLYTAICTTEVIPGIFSLPTITLRTATTITVVPAPGGTPSGILACIAIPDSDTSTIRKSRVAFTSSPATVTVTWSPAFAGNAYTTACTVESSSAGVFTSVISTFTAASIVVDNSGYASGTMHCIGIPNDGTNPNVIRRPKALISGSPNTVAVTFGAPFNLFTNDNTDYVAACSDVEPTVTSSTAALAILAGSKTVNGFTVINQIPSGTLDCIAVPLGGSASSRFTEDTTQATAQSAAITTGLLTPPDPLPAPACVPAGAALQGTAKSVWQVYVAPENGTVVADTRFSSYPTILSAWTISTALPSSTETFTPLACASGNVPAAGSSPVESSVRFNVTQGTTYYLMVSDATSTGAGGTLTFSIDAGDVAPPNDDNATPITVTPAQLPYDDTVNSVLATANTNTHTDPTPPCAPAGAASSGQANSVWYTFTPTSSGTVTADTLTSPYETILNVTSGSPTGTQVACNASAASGIAQSQVSFAATASTTYFFMVSSVLGDGGTTNFHLNFSASVGNPVPTLTSFSPANATAGGAAFALTINGSNFVSGVTGTFNGNARTVTFVSATQVTMAVTAADIATAGSFPVVISNPAPGGGPSTPLNFQVNNPAATLTLLSPSSATVGGSAFNLTITGSNFVNGATGTFNGNARTVTFNSSTQVTMAVTAPDIATAGSFAVNVSNPGPGGGSNGALLFSVNNVVPTITSIAPTSATVGGAGFNLTVTGTGYISGSAVKFNGTSVTTTFNSSTQLTAAIPASLIASVGSFPVTVTNPGPGGGVSNSVSFNVTAGPPATMTANAGTTPQSATISTAFANPLAVTVKDAGSNPVSGVNVTFTAPGSGASGVFSNSTATITVATNASGVASAPFTANATAGGPYTVTAAATGLTTVNFSLTNNAGAAASMTANAGTTPQSAAINTTFANALAVIVKDAGSNPVSGVNVTFTAPGSGASGKFSNNTATITVATNASGVASAPFTANATAGGPYTVTAAATGLTTVNFSLTNNAGAAASMTANAGTTPQSATINTAFANALAVTVTDAGSNPVSGVNVTFTAPGSGASGKFSNNTATITVATNASGVASAPFTANATAGGPYTVTAAATGLTTVNFSLTNLTGAAGSMTANAGTTPQSAAINTAFANALAVTVKDAGSNPVSGVNVTFTAPGSGASGVFSNNTATITVATNASGVASAPFTANATAGGPYSVTAAATGLATVNFSLTNTAGAASSMTANAGTTPQLATINTAFANPLAVTVKDAGSNPVSGVNVTFTAPGSGASGKFSNNTATINVATDASGIASAPFTANATAGGPYTVTATATGLTTVNFSLTNTAGAASSMTANAGTTPQSATVNTAFANALAVTVKDASSNPVSGVNVTFTAPGSGASGKFSNNTATINVATNASGVASAPFTANGTAGGPYTVTAAATGLTTVNFSLTNTAGAAVLMTVNAGSTPQSTAVNTAFVNPLAVTVNDASSNPVPGVSVTFTAPGAGASGKFSNNTATITVATNASGVASAPFTANATAGGPYSVTAAATGLTTANFSLTNTAGAAASMTANAGTTPQSATINTAFANPLAVTVKDASSNPISGVNVTFTAPGSGASGKFSNNTATINVATDASGVAAAPFNANATAGGPYTVTATAAGVPTVNFSLTNNAGAAASMTANAGTTPQSAAINTAFANPLAVTVNDASNNPVSGVNVTFTAPGSGASGVFSNNTATITVATNASGVASAPFTANATVGGPYAVTAAATGLTTVNFSLTNNAGPAATITATAGTPQSVAISTAFPILLQATVKDAGSNPISGVTVTFAAPASGASGTFAGGATTAITNASGVATAAVFTANTIAGSYTVTAKVSGVATPANFSLTNTPGQPASIAATAGTPQSATIGTAFATQLQATVKDAGGNLVNAGIVVTFLAPATGASGTFAGGVNTAMTNASGVATAAVFTANGTAGGPYTVAATVVGVATPANFSLTNNNPVPTITAPLVPASANAGGATFLLTINGTNFVTGATVTFGSNPSLTPASVTSTKITVNILAADIATGGTPNVTVSNPAPGGGASNAVAFTVNNPAPTLAGATVNGNNHASGGAAFTLTATGTLFVSTSTINFNGKAEPTTFVSATQITAAIPANDVSTAGTFPVTVTNPAPAGGTTAAVNFTVDGYTVSGPANTTVKAGSQAMIQITVTPSANGFANAIMFSVSGLPAHTTASFSPTSVTPGTKVATTTLTINTTARGTAPPTAPENPPVPPLLRVLPFAWLAALLIAAYAMRLVRRVPQFRRYAAFVPLALLLITGAALAGCIGGKSGTPAGPAQLTITATSGTLTQSTAPNSVTLTVQ